MVDTLAELIKILVISYKKRTCIIDRGMYSRRKYSYDEIYERALKLCSYFDENKIKRGDRIITYLPNSSDYASLLWACSLSGVIVVPLDFNSEIAFVERVYKKVDCKRVFCSVFKQPDNCKKFFVEEIDKIYDNFKKLEPKTKIKPEDIFEIVYTSGTITEPKGVVLTHKNLVSNILSMKELIDFRVNNYNLLSILPMSHLFEQNVGFFIALWLGSRIIYISSKKPSYLLDILNQEKINGIVSVPLFLESLKRKIEAESEQFGKKSALEKAIKKYADSSKIIKEIVFRKIRAKFRNLDLFIVGGAALDIDTEKFWKALGVTVIQGYGLTETSPVLTCNNLKNNKMGSVGKPLKGIELKILDEEILASGDNVFSSYYQNDTETRNAFIIREGKKWFLTGDRGRIDEDGFIYLTGRKKNMILSSSGMNIYPEDIESVLSKIAGIKSSVVLGLNNGKTVVGIVLSDKKVDESKVLKEANSHLAFHQSLSKIYQWHDKDFPRTPTLKIIRRKVEEGIKLGKIEKSKSKDILRGLISKVCEVSESKISEKSKLINLGLDSVKRIELVTEIEEEYGIDFNESLINEKTTLEELREHLKNSKEEKTESGLNFLNSRIFNPLRFIIQELAFIGLSLFYRVKVRGLENLPEETCILIANHSSMLDAFSLYKALPFSCRMNTSPAAAKDFFFENKITGFFGRMSFNAFGFARKGNTKQSLKDFSSLINKNMNVLIYPEGTRSREGKLLEFKEGIGILGWELGVPIVPVKLEGLYEILPVGRRFPRFGKVRVIIGKPLKFNKMISPNEITKTLHGIVKNLQ